MSRQTEKTGLSFTIRFGVVSVFLLATVLTASIAIGLQYYFSYRQALDSALLGYRVTAERTAEHLAAMDRKSSDVTLALSHYPQLIDPDGKPGSTMTAVFAEVMSLNPMLYAIYLGFDNGDFHQLINLDAAPALRARFDARDEDRWLKVVITGEREARYKRTDYLGVDMQLRHSVQEPSQYDPRSRPWYLAADVDRVFRTRPYLFESLKAPGQTYSLDLVGRPAVLGVDVALASLSEYLRHLPVTAGTELYLYQINGDLVASNAALRSREVLTDIIPLELTTQQRALVSNVRLRVSNELDWAPVDFAVSGMPTGYAIDLLAMVEKLIGVEFEYVNGYSWRELVALFRQGRIDVLQPILQTDSNRELGHFSEPFLTLPFALASLQSAASATHLDQLSGRRLAVGEGWSIVPYIREHYPQIEVIEVPSTVDALRAVLSGHADAAIDNAIVLRFNQQQYFFEGLRLVESDALGLPEEFSRLYLLVGHDQAELMDVLNLALANITPAQHRRLASRWLHQANRLVTPTATVPYPDMLGSSAPLDNGQALETFEHAGRAYYRYRSPVAEQSDMQFAVVVAQDLVTGPAARHVLWAVLVTAGCITFLLPTAWLFAAPIVRPIRALQEESRKVSTRQYDQIRHIHSHIIEIDDLGASMSEMAQSIHRHEINQAALMESIIQLIAQAIDDKSTYTGGHCERVPALGLMLAEAASESDDIAFRDFRLDNEDKQREFRIAAWLHDCGKITTPEHIVDKGTKLETIYNRIHEIRTRFEVLWRDAEIEYWQSLHAQPDQKAQWQERLLRQREVLQQEFAQVAAANIGGESMSAEQQARLHAIGKRTWQRHFDDRLGLSPVEQRRGGEAVTPLPVTEALLADKPEHRIPWERAIQYPKHLGIRMTVPELQANLGELYNLCTERGTLTAEDRFRINEHIINTIRMLDGLPFPDELSRVPKYASTHHERLDGEGYPRKLDASALEVPDRILAVADVFEALTAADRPYKQAKPLSESLAIMQAMVREGHIDADVFRLFLCTGIYRRYADQYLAPEQLDVQDPTPYLAP